MQRRLENQDQNGLPLALRRKITLSRLASGLETLWPHLALIGVVLAFFVAASWLGLFSFTPRAARIGFGLVFLAALGFSLWRACFWRAPDIGGGARRLDLSEPDLHRPVAVLTDRAAGDDPVAALLWERHQRRAEEAAAALHVPPPRNFMPALDGFALRSLAILLLVAAGFIAGDERRNRIADAFAWGEILPPPTPPRLDAWIDPPVYTGRAPIFLSGNAAISGPIPVPVGSIATLRVVPADGVTVTASAQLKPREAAPADAGNGPRPVAKAAENVFERRIAIEGDGLLEVFKGGVSLGKFELKSIPDVAPTAELVAIEPDEKGQNLKLRYRLNDDYGVVRADAIMTRTDRPGARTLVPPPDVSISGRIGENESVITPQEHFWAGVKVALKIRATDDLGQTGDSASKEITLPVRRFENPVSRALVEQRRNIVMNPDDRRRVQIGIDGIMVAPERFTPKAGDFLMLSIAARKLRDARTDADLMALATYLWETAVALDEGGLTEAERALRAAEERLREALERGATPDEISKLMQELRQAMNEFLKEFAERAQRNQDGRENERDRNNRTLSQRDLNDMLKRIEELYRQGDTAKAQELLRQMQEMMKNLQSARRQNNADPRMKEMAETLDELEQMMRDQEGLRDETFRDNQKRRQSQNRPQRNQPGQQGQRGQRQQGQQGQQGDQGDQGDDDGDEGEDGQGGEGQAQKPGQGLAERQQALRDRLNQLREKMKRQQGGQGGQAQEGLDGADDGMGEAEGNLRQRQSGRATEGQQRAIDELGKAGRGLSQQMRREMGDGTEPGDDGDGEGEGPGNPDGNPRGRAESKTDPLGRPMGQRGTYDNDSTKLPQPGGLPGPGIAERAQRALEELRRRFGDIARPPEELEYIERLLRRNGP